MTIDKKFWSNKNIVITGHTGFKGSWLAVFLNELGANLFGISREKKEGIYAIANISTLFKHEDFLDLSEDLNEDNVKNLIDAKGSISTKYWEEGFFEKLKSLKNNFKEVSSYKCIGYEYIDIGKGKRNFAILSKLSPWDHIPGVLFVREAGGSDIDFDHQPYNFLKQNNNLIVGNSKEFNLIILNKLGV